MNMNALRVFAAGLMLATLAACGGGGGNSGGGASAVSGGPVDTGLASLVPKPPALGRVIVADAAVLRPLKDGAVWNYRGTDVGYSGGTPVYYQTSTTQKLSSANSATESASNSSNAGADTQPVTISAGTVGALQSVDFAGKGVPELVQFIELRSPVREGDQYTILERRYTDTSVDLDGDKKPDALDVAIYGRVVGVEALSLRNLPSLSTVRVDTFMRQRAIYSSTGLPSPVAEVLVQTWYARDIGIVRQKVTSPSSQTDFEVKDEQLVSWDGVDSGFGAMPSRAAVIPASSPVRPGQVLPDTYSLVGTASFGDHALVALNNPQPATGVLIARLDLLGRVVSVRQHDTLVAGEGYLIGHAQGMVNVRARSDGAGMLPAIALTRFDSDGVLLGSVDGTTIDMKGTRVDPMMGPYRAAIDGTTLWIMWSRIYNTPAAQLRELLVRPYDLSGNALGPEVKLYDSESFAYRIVGTGGRALLAWGSVSVVGYGAMYASVAMGETTPTVRTLAPDLPMAAVLQSFMLTPVPVGAQGALLWNSPLAGDSLTGTAGVLLDANLAPVRAGVTLTNELLPGVPPFHRTPNVGGSTDRQRIVLSTEDSGPLLWLNEGMSRATTLVSWLDATAAPLAATPIQQVRIASIDPAHMLIFPDRVLLLSSASGLSTTVVWLNHGGVL